MLVLAVSMRADSIGCAVGGGLFRTPKPSSTWMGLSTSAVWRASVASAAVSTPPAATPPLRPSVEMRRSISTNSPDIGRLDQSELAVTWNRMSWPSPRRAAVTSGVPSLSRAQICTSCVRRAGSASTWRLTRTSGGMARPVNRLDSSKAASGCGVDHDKRAAERAPAEAQAHRDQLVAALLEPGTGEAHEHAALLHPVVHPLHEVAGQGADVGHDQHGRVLLEGLAHRCREVGVLRAHQLGERRQRFLDVVERRQQRLRLLAVLARDEPDPMPARARIEQMHGAGRALAGDLHARDLVAELERQLEPHRRAAGARRELERRLAEPLAACRERQGNAAALSAIGAQDVAPRACRPGRDRRRQPAPHRRSGSRSPPRRPIRRGSRACRRTRALAVVIDAVRQPDDAGLRLAGQRALEDAPPFPCAAARTAAAAALPPSSARRSAPRCARSASCRPAPSARSGPGGSGPRLPRSGDRRGACARQSATAAAQPLSTTMTTGPEPFSAVSGLGLSTGSASARITSAAAAMRISVSHHGVLAGVFSRLIEVEQDARRREGDAARTRRNGAQQPVDERQRRQRAQQPRIEEGERAERHRALRAPRRQQSDRLWRRSAAWRSAPAAARPRTGPCDARGTTSRAWWPGPRAPSRCARRLAG